MKQWQEKDLKFLLDPKFFPECVECGSQFFHKAGCGRGKNLPAMELNKRLNERLQKFEKEHGEDGSNLGCRHCSNTAVGKMLVFFHGTESVCDSWPVCWNHAWHEDSVGRKTQFQPF